MRQAKILLLIGCVVFLWKKGTGQNMVYLFHEDYKSDNSIVVLQFYKSDSIKCYDYTSIFPKEYYTKEQEEDSYYSSRTVSFNSKCQVMLGNIYNLKMGRRGDTIGFNMLRYVEPEWPLDTLFFYQFIVQKGVKKFPYSTFDWSVYHYHHKLQGDYTYFRFFEYQKDTVIKFENLKFDCYVFTAKYNNLTYTKKITETQYIDKKLLIPIKKINVFFDYKTGKYDKTVYYDLKYIVDMKDKEFDFKNDLLKYCKFCYKMGYPIPPAYPGSID